MRACSVLKDHCGFVDLGGANEDSPERWKPKFIPDAHFDVDKSELFFTLPEVATCLYSLIIGKAHHREVSCFFDI